MPLMRTVTLITDYGTRDYYAGALKGVILGIAPDTRVVDVTHDIEPHNVLHGAFVLRHVLPCYAPGTTHLVVVDPGVGSSRKILIGRFDGQYVVAPDNGLITWLHRDFPAEALHVAHNPRYMSPMASPTFHGSDIMAPIAAHIASGIDLNEFGPATDKIETLSVGHRAERTRTGLRGCAIYVDRFGNVVTNVHEDQLEPADQRAGSQVVVNGQAIGPIRGTFRDVPPGEALALIGSTGFLEICAREASAAERFRPAERMIVDIPATLTA
jgi:S-adenosylmethionine hydrolase